jgi:hypothetical protein
LSSTCDPVTTIIFGKLNLSAPVSIVMTYYCHLTRRLADEGSKFFERYNEELRQRSAFPLDFSRHATHLRDLNDFETKCFSRQLQKEL